MILVAWVLAVVVMFGPGVCVGWLLLRRNGQHRALRAAVAAYSHIPPRHRR